jgi:hypothetical protein
MERDDRPVAPAPGPHPEEDPAEGLSGVHGGTGAGVPAPGDDTNRGQLDSAGGGYGSQSGDASSSGTGDGEAGASGEMDDGTTSRGTGATGAGPTEWLRDAQGSDEDMPREDDPVGRPAGV